MLFERQRLLLTLLDALGGSAADTDFQKLLFAYTQSQAFRSNSYDASALKQIVTSLI